MAWPLLFSNKLEEIFLGLLLTGYILLALVSLASLILGTFVTIVMGAKGRDEQAVTRERLLEKTGHLQKLQEAYLGMDTNGDGRLSLEAFRRGLEENPKLCHLLGVPMDKVDTIYRLANNGSSRGEHASVDDLMIGLLKHTGMSRTIEQLSLDHQQQRVRRSIGQAAYYYATSVQTLKALLDRVARDLAALTRRVEMLAESLRVQTPLTELLTGPSEEEVLRGAPRLTALLSQSLERSLLNDLDLRYRFKGRLLEVEAGLSREAERAADDPSEALAIAPALFGELLEEEVMPWVHHEMASLQAMRLSIARRARARRETPSGSPVVAKGDPTPTQSQTTIPPVAAASSDPALGQAPAGVLPERTANVSGQEVGIGGSSQRPRIWQALAAEVRRVDPASPWYRQ